MRFLYAVPTMTVYEVVVEDEALDAVDRATVERLRASRDERALALWWEDQRHRFTAVTWTETRTTSEGTDAARRVTPPWAVLIGRDGKRSDGRPE